MACCHPPKTEEGRTGLALLSVLEMQIGLTGGASAEVAAFRQAHPEFTGAVDTIVHHWRQGRLGTE
jgi:hypothetical protein